MYLSRSLKSWYDELSFERTAYVDRAIECAKPNLKHFTSRRERRE